MCCAVAFSIFHTFVNFPADVCRDFDFIFMENRKLIDIRFPAKLHPSNLCSVEAFYSYLRFTH